METTIIEFLVGVVAGTISGVLIVKRTGRKTSQRRALPNVKLDSFRDRRLPKQAKIRQVRSRRSNSKSARTKTVSLDMVLEASRSLATPMATTVLTCPSCGLAAPESLMAEHFMGSPSHKNGPPRLPPIVAGSEQEAPKGIPTEDSRDSLRHLLQMLVPPRAFGRRHGQRTVDPLSSFIQTMDSSRKGPV